MFWGVWDKIWNGLPWFTRTSVTDGCCPFSQLFCALTWQSISAPPSLVSESPCLSLGPLSPLFCTAGKPFKFHIKQRTFSWPSFPTLLQFPHYIYFFKIFLCPQNISFLKITTVFGLGSLLLALCPACKSPVNICGIWVCPIGQVLTICKMFREEHFFFSPFLCLLYFLSFTDGQFPVFFICDSNKMRGMNM